MKDSFSILEKKRAWKFQIRKMRLSPMLPKLLISGKIISSCGSRGWYDEQRIDGRHAWVFQAHVHACTHEGQHGKLKWVYVYGRCPIMWIEMKIYCRLRQGKDHKAMLHLHVALQIFPWSKWILGKYFWFVTLFPMGPLIMLIFLRLLLSMPRHPLCRANIDFASKDLMTDVCTHVQRKWYFVGHISYNYYIIIIVNYIRSIKILYKIYIFYKKYRIYTYQ